MGMTSMARLFVAGLVLGLGLLAVGVQAVSAESDASGEETIAPLDRLNWDNR